MPKTLYVSETGPNLLSKIENRNPSPSSSERNRGSSQIRPDSLLIWSYQTLKVLGQDDDDVVMLAISDGFANYTLF